MEKQVKGYVLQVSQRFLLDDPALASKVPAAVLEDIRQAEPSIKPSDWYPSDDVVLVWRAIADAAPDEAAALAALKSCGRAIAGTAVTTFFKLLLKVLSPRMFASKFPDFWSRDHRRGIASIESVGDKHMILLIHDVEGYDHVGATAAGFIGFALEAIGLKQVMVTPSPWSLAQPGPTKIRIEARWP